MADKLPPTGGAKPLSLFDHWLIECAIRHNAAVKAALLVDPATLQDGRSKGEGEVSRLSIELIQKLHRLPDLIRNYGADEVFGNPARPLTEEQKAPARL